LLNEASTYLLEKFDDRPFETDLKGYGRIFPHPFGKADSKLFSTLLLASPVGDQLNNEFAKTLIINEELGKDDIPDYLSISFSSVDVINHFFGPSSLENEDIVLQLDRTLANLLAFVDRNVGLDQTLIVLSADHGMAEAPEFMASMGMAVGRIYTEEIIKIANDATFEKFGIKDITKRFFRPYLYLNEKVITDAKLDRVAVERVIADALTHRDGIAMAVPTSALATMQDTPLLRKIRNNHHSERSGDIYLVQEPYWFLYEKGPVAVMHGSPWRYDTHVPVIFSGPQISEKTVYRDVFPADVAPTLSAYLGVKSPSSAVGNPLKEVLANK